MIVFFIMPTLLWIFGILHMIFRYKQSVDLELLIHNSRS